MMNLINIIFSATVLAGSVVADVDSAMGLIIVGAGPAVLLVKDYPTTLKERKF